MLLEWIEAVEMGARKSLGTGAADLEMRPYDAKLRLIHSQMVQTGCCRGDLARKPCMAPFEHSPRQYAQLTPPWAHIPNRYALFLLQTRCSMTIQTGSNIARRWKVGSSLRRR